jgi:hypothetical protein
MIQLSNKYQSCGKKFLRFNPKTTITTFIDEGFELPLTAYFDVAQPEKVYWLDENLHDHWDHAYVDQSLPDTKLSLIRDFRQKLMNMEEFKPHTMVDLTSATAVTGNPGYSEPVASPVMTEPLKVHDAPAPSAKQDDHVERTTQVQIYPIPNPHLDKTLLTKDELREVLAWAIEQSTGETFPKPALDELATLQVVGKPTTAVDKLVALLGELVYGENNYIGPSKTGNVDATLEQIVTTVPVQNEQDARARAHDIALTVDPSPVHDQILTGLARTAQVARPYVQTPTDRLAALRQRYAFTSASELAKDGDVERNPGPIYKLDGKDSADDAIKIVSDPTDATSYLNDAGTDWRVDEYAYNTRKGNWALRAGLDNQTDYVQLDDFYAQYLQVSYSDAGAARVFRGAAFFNYAINNKEVKATLANDALGTAITSALNNIDTFTAMQRTQTNSINGDALINIFQRAPKTDYGCYLPIAKLLAYELGKGPLSGQESLCQVFDHMVRGTPNVISAIVDTLYPGSDNHNWGALPPGIVIEAYYCTPTTASRMMTGAVPTPAGWGVDSRDVAWVVCSGNLNPQALSYYTICHLEYPFFGTLDNIQRVFPVAAGGVPVVNAAFAPPANLWGNVIQGHKYKVMYVTMTEPINDLFLSGGGANANIQEWTGVGVPPAATDILPILQLYINTVWRNVFGGVTPDFTEVLQFMLKFADKDDWRAAMWLASSMQGFKDYPIFQLAATAGGSATVLRCGTNPAPSIDATVTTRDTATLSVANQGAVADVCVSWPKWNMSGIPSQRVDVGALPPAGGSTPRAAGAISCFVQDTAWITKLAISMNMLQKSVLAKSDVEKLLKLRLKNLYFAHRHLADLGFQMTHNYFQDMGITKRQVFAPGNAVMDRRIQIFTKLYISYGAFFKLYAGWKFMRPQMPPMPVIAQNGAGIGAFYDRDAYLDSPVYLFDHSVFLHEAKQYYDFKTEVNYTLMDHDKLILEPGQAGNQNIFGLPSGGNAVVRMRYHEAITAPTSTITRWKNEYRVAFAKSKTLSLLNPAPITNLIDVYVTEIHGNLPIHFRCPMSHSLGWLRWSSLTAPSDTFRTSARQFLIWTLPWFPPEQNAVSGQPLLLSGNSQSDFFRIRLAYNMLGRGSSNYGMTQLLSTLDGDLTISENPF